jgi:hypothetical protein
MPNKFIISPNKFIILSILPNTWQCYYFFAIDCYNMLYKCTMDIWKANILVVRGKLACIHQLLLLLSSIWSGIPKNMYLQVKYTLQWYFFVKGCYNMLYTCAMGIWKAYILDLRGASRHGFTNFIVFE